MDDDDDFLYGSTSVAPEQASQSAVVAQLESAAANLREPLTPENPDERKDENTNINDDEAESVQESEESDDDIEFIMEPTSRILDNRQQQNRPPPPRAHSHLTLNANANPPTVAAPSTAEIQRLAPPISTQATLENFPSSSTLRADLSIPGVTTTNLEPLAPLTEPQDDIDTNALPPVTAPPSHPSIDPSLDGSIEGRSIIEVDLSALSDKPWRKPGSDISDWFNYGFDEVSWEAYCYRRRDVGDLTTVLKTAVLTFTNLPEDQISQLPPEVRQMVMTGTSAMLTQNAAAVANGYPHPGMMDMGMMGGPMDMGMPMMMHPDGPPGGMPPPGTMHPNGISQNGPDMSPEGGEYIEQPSPQHHLQQQQPSQYQVPRDQLDNSPPPPTASAGGVGRGNGGERAPSTSTVQNAYAGRAAPPVTAPTGPAAAGARGRGGYIRGRGRGYIDTRPPPPARPISPLPANVPTGPRSQNKYKDKDRDVGHAGESLDYGGGKDRESPVEEKGESGRGRKRRGSPSYDDRGSKRR